MAVFARTNTFVSGTSITASGHNTNWDDVTTWLNNRYNGSDTWSFMKVSSTDTNPVDITSNAGTTKVSINNTATDGDPMVLFNLSGSTQFSIGVDDSDSDRFKISNSSSLGSADLVIIDQATTSVSTRGTNTNDSASAGFKGEYISSTIASASAVSLTNNTYADVTSIDLTAGDWDVSAIVVFSGVGVTGTEFGGGIGTASGNSSTGTSFGDNFADTSNAPTATANPGVSIPTFRISLPSSSTRYLKGFALFSLGSVKAYGRISARRVR